MRYLLVISMLLSGCSCFQVCKDIPKPPELIKPTLCYTSLNSGASTERILKCYMLDIINLKKYSEEQFRALEAYK